MKTRRRNNGPGHRWGSAWLCAVCFATLVAGGTALLLTPHNSTGRIALPHTLSRLLALSNNLPPGLSVTRMNLLCAEGLSLAVPPPLEQCESTVRAWAERVKSETERHWHKFRQNPGQFERSEAYFRMLMLTVVLGEDFGLHYSKQRKGEIGAAYVGDGFFAKPDEVFV